MAKKKSAIRVVASVQTSNAILLALTTYSMGTSFDLPRDARCSAADPLSLIRRQEESEKVSLSNTGKTLNFMIAGKPGRHCAVVFRTSRMRETEHLFLAPTKAVLNEAGLATISIDMSKFLDRTYEFRVVTSDTKEFKTDLRGTLPFQIRMSSRRPEKINEFKISTSDPAVAVAATASVAQELKR